MEPAQLFCDLPDCGAFHSRAIGEHANGSRLSLRELTPANLRASSSVLISTHSKGITAMQEITNHVADSGSHSSVIRTFKTGAG